MSRRALAARTLRKMLGHLNTTLTDNSQVIDKGSFRGLYNLHIRPGGVRVPYVGKSTTSKLLKMNFKVKACPTNLRTMPSFPTAHLGMVRETLISLGCAGKEDLGKCY